MPKLPPYGKELFLLQQKGERPANSVNLWIGVNAWKKGQAFIISMPNRTLVLPAWESPDAYFWPVEDCSVLIHETSFAEPDYIQDLVFCLSQAGASQIVLCSYDFIITSFHKE